MPSLIGNDQNHVSLKYTVSTKCSVTDQTDQLSICATISIYIYIFLQKKHQFLFRTTCETNFYAKIIYSYNMSLDNIVVTIQSLSEESNKLSENEEANLYVYLTDKDTKLADVEKLLNLCKTNNAKLVYLKGLSKKSVSGAFL